MSNGMYAAAAVVATATFIIFVYRSKVIAGCQTCTRRQQTQDEHQYSNNFANLW